jgi:hypothetical protein
MLKKQSLLSVFFFLVLVVFGPPACCWPFAGGLASPAGNSSCQIISMAGGHTILTADFSLPRGICVLGSGEQELLGTKVWHRMGTQ